jgi:exoribonuclease R
VSHRFFKSVILSKAALSYGEAQALHDDPSQNDATTTSLRLLTRLTRVLRRRRNARGALLLASPAVTFSLDREV